MQPDELNRKIYISKLMTMDLFWLLVACVHVCSGNKLKHKLSEAKWKYKDNGYEAFKRSDDESSGSHVTWDYGTMVQVQVRYNGPETWGGDCKGKSQSPINIVTCETSDSTEINRISHNYGEKPSGEYTIKNNGHALQIDLPIDTEYRLQKGDKTYTPLQIHIHFDPLTGKGSEHTLNSRKYFAEIHIVHKDTESDGLLVIGMFVELVKDAKKTDYAVRVFANAAKELREPGRKIALPAFTLQYLFPQIDRKNSNLDYVNYKGSLTTPPCSEIVDWIVITGQVLRVKQKMANQFKFVLNSSGTNMAGNNRPIQDLNGRDVYGVNGRIE